MFHDMGKLYDVQISVLINKVLLEHKAPPMQSVVFHGNGVECGNSFPKSQGSSKDK